MRERPVCPKCIDSTWVRSKSCGSKKKYYYICNLCKAYWMQFPPDSQHVKDGGDAEITFPRPKNSKEYTCSKCGVAKKGHICKAKGIEKERSSELFQTQAPQPQPFQFPSLSFSSTTRSDDLSFDAFAVVDEAQGDALGPLCAAANARLGEVQLRE
jgi:predicted RNA-binding Zn-ribbon protein involved in translation (DUF1610 family)